MMTPKQIVGLVAVAVIASAGGWAVWSVVGPKLAEAKRERDLAQDGQVSAELEVEGATTVAEAVEDYTAQGGRIVERTYVIREQALAAPDAAAPLPADRADRLGEHDRFLCGERPVCGAAAGGVADPGGETLQPVRPAADADAG